MNYGPPARRRRPTGKKQRTTTRKRGFPRYLLAVIILLLVNTVLIFLALNWLYNTLTEMEAATPATAINRYFQRLSEGDMDAIDTESGFVPDGANTWDDYHQYVKELYAGVPQSLRYRKVSVNRPDGGQTYALYDGATRLGEILLYEGQGQDGGWRVCAPVEYGKTYTITAPGHVTVLMNGEPLDKAAAVSAPVEAFADLPETEPQPVTLTYETSSTLHEPSFEAVDVWNRPCPIAETDEGLVATVELDEETRAAYAARVEEVAKIYANYASNDVPFNTLGAHIYPGSELYGRMYNYPDRMWVIGHHTPTFHDLSVFDIISCSETCFTGKIEFTYNMVETGRNVEHSRPTAYFMAFTLVNGQWMLLDLQML